MATQQDVYAALKRHFGFDEFRDGQYQPIFEVLSGRDAVVVMPTGSGKSLCYQLAALMLPDIPVLAVTATATPDVRADIVRQLKLGEDILDVLRDGAS